jgi:hypothetical protein
MNKTFYLLVTGPKVYLPGGRKLEKIEITQEDIDDTREGDESDEDVLNYFIEDEISAWEQHWCKAVVITEDEYNKLKQ